MIIKKDIQPEIKLSELRPELRYYDLIEQREVLSEQMDAAYTILNPDKSVKFHLDPIEAVRILSKTGSVLEEADSIQDLYDNLRTKVCEKTTEIAKALVEISQYSREVKDRAIPDLLDWHIDLQERKEQEENPREKKKIELMALDIYNLIKCYEGEEMIVNWPEEERNDT